MENEKNIMAKMRAGEWCFDAAKCCLFLLSCVPLRVLEVYLYDCAFGGELEGGQCLASGHDFLLVLCDLFGWGLFILISGWFCIIYLHF